VRETRYSWQIAAVHNALGALYSVKREDERAEAAYRCALEQAVLIGSADNAAASLCGLAALGTTPTSSEELRYRGSHIALRIGNEGLLRTEAVIAAAAAAGSVTRSTQLNTLVVANQEQLSAVISRLEALGTLRIKVRDNGLHGAADPALVNTESGYHYTWIRDSVMIANSDRERGNHGLAARTVRSLSRYLARQEHRFLRIIDDPYESSW